MQAADHAKVRVFKHPVHDPHDVIKNTWFRIERRHEYGHIRRTLVINHDERPPVQAPADVVTLLHNVVAGAPGPHRHHGEQPTEQIAFDSVEHFRRISADGHQQREPYDVGRDAVQVVRDDQEETQ